MRGIGLRAKRAVNTLAGWFAVGGLKALRLIDPDRMGDFAAWVMRRVGPRLREHRIGRANLTAAFPEKSAAEIEDILAGVWDNLGRVGAEIAHLDRLWDYDQTRKMRGRILDSDESLARVCALRDDNMPALIFAAHLSNWELAAIGATAFGLNTTVLYRRPNLGAVADALIKLRAGSMGTLVPTGLDAPVKLMRTLEAGGHVALLVDQYNVQGVDVTFFGRKTKANPLIARLARHFDCPIHGVRVIREGRHNYRLDLSEALTVPRDAEGKPDIVGTMQAITDMVEKWVREHPEQWLWLHRRWR
jgi:Kdo2-lipid IVA lauroyltransferase/acyltransferase